MELAASAAECGEAAENVVFAAETEDAAGANLAFAAAETGIVADVGGSIAAYFGAEVGVQQEVVAVAVSLAFHPRPTDEIYVDVVPPAERVPMPAFAVPLFRQCSCTQHIDNSWSNSHHLQSTHNTESHLWLVFAR